MKQKISDFYQQIILDDKEKHLNDFALIAEKLNNSNAKYKGKIIDFLYQPMFFHQGDIARFEYITKTMMSIIIKCTDEYLRNPDFRKYFEFSKIMEELILIDPGYQNPVPVARLDIFYADDYKFCELNGDGTSAMNETNTLERIFTESAIIKNLRKNYKISYYELFVSWLRELLETYKEFGSTNKPNIAITDFSGLGSNEEFDTFKAVFEKEGYKTIICDPREMKYKNGKLYFENTQIDLIYRRAVNKEIELRIDELTEFIKAYKDNAVCVVGPFRSQIMHNKRFFEILCDENKTIFFSSEERDFINKHIPKTYSLNESTLQKALQNKDKYLIKPDDMYAGKGVVCGIDVDYKNWQEELNKAVENGNFLLQEFCNFTQKRLPVITGNNIIFEDFKTTLGLFTYNGKLSGLYSRVGRKNVIAGVAESITLPSFVYKKMEQ
jgi:hypothetical protein